MLGRDPQLLSGDSPVVAPRGSNASSVGHSTFPVAGKFVRPPAAAAPTPAPLPPAAAPASGPPAAARPGSRPPAPRALPHPPCQAQRLGLTARTPVRRRARPGGTAGNARCAPRTLQDPTRAGPHAPDLGLGRRGGAGLAAAHANPQPGQGLGDALPVLLSKVLC